MTRTILMTAALAFQVLAAPIAQAGGPVSYLMIEMEKVRISSPSPSNNAALAETNRK